VTKLFAGAVGSIGLTNETHVVRRVRGSIFCMRIAGVTIPEHKRLEVGLTAVYGVGLSKVKRILAAAKISGVKKPPELSGDEEGTLRQLIEGERIEGELRREISTNIKRLKDIQSYRGSRHVKRLPARGQRTKTNARTLKGVRKTMGSGRRKLEKT
jgi:small subunit ribosomal protein S13